jgi:lipopolysaccharide/colanic/teichoic acid biosynthesis glycosyltransferase
MYRKTKADAVTKTSTAKFTIHPYYFSWQKRAFDMSISSLALIFGLPFLLIIAAAVLFFSGPPIFFGQKRTGKGKKPFIMWKFRTMKLGADKEQKRYWRCNEAPAPMFKMLNDPRYTKIGKFLSATGIDELPQLWNILRGEMSMVGPRPLPLKESEKLEKMEPKKSPQKNMCAWDFRYEVLPGVISEWAVNSKRFQSLAKWQTLEKDTLKNGGLTYDLGLIRRTVVYLARIF